MVVLLLLLSVVIDIYGAQISDKIKSSFNQKMFEVEHSVDHRCLAVHNDPGHQISCEDYKKMLSNLRKTKNQESKVDYLMVNDKIFKMQRYEWHPLDLGDRTMADIQTEHIDKEKKGIVICCIASNEDTFDLEDTKQKIMSWQDNGWRIYFDVKNFACAMKIKNWQQSRDAAGTYQLIYSRDTFSYRPVAVVIGMCAILLIYHFSTRTNVSA